MKKYILGCLLVCLILNQLSAQSAERRWALGIHPGAYSFYALDNGIFNGEDYGPGVQFSFMRYLGSSVDLGLEFDLASVRHKDNTAALRAGQRDNFFAADLAVRLKMNNNLILKEESIIGPFIRLGFGAQSYTNFENIAMFAPIGLGARIRIPKTPIAIIPQTSYNLGINSASFLHHSIGVAFEFGKKGAKKNTLSEAEKAREMADRDYDGVPDQEDRCPDIYGDPKAQGCPDRDGDGVKDSEDKCPDEKGFANLLGCVDSDYDGFIDPEDKCPNEYGEGDFGCPENSIGDSDGDGVPDSEDACPDTPGVFTASGCPDSDGDGVADSEDKCYDHYGLPEYDGCPMPYEELQLLTNYYYGGGADEFGIDTTETGSSASFVDNTGEGNNGNNTSSEFNNGNGNDTNNGNNSSNNNNPDLGTSFPANGSGLVIGDPIIEKYALGSGVDFSGFTEDEFDADCANFSLKNLKAAIYFDYNRSSIDVSSRQALDQIVEAMRRCATFELQVAGHTDNHGSSNYNQSLSERRAKAVLRYVIDAGVSEKRLKFNGYGERYPIAPNTSPNERQLNRRAEIKINRAY